MRETLFDEPTERLLKQEQPARSYINSCFRCCCTSFVLFSRFLISNTIALGLGVGTDIGVTWICEQIDHPTVKHSLMLLNRVLGYGVSLLTVYGVNWALSKCCPTTPRKVKADRNYHFFQIEMKEQEITNSADAFDTAANTSVMNPDFDHVI